MGLFNRNKKKVPQIVPEERVVYPGGVCVETESGRYYLKDNRKHKIKEEVIFKSWNFPTVVKSTDAAIAGYTNSLRSLHFRDGHVARDIYNLELFIFSGGERFMITSVEMYNYLDLDNRDIPYASHEIIRSHPEGGTL